MKEFFSLIGDICVSLIVWIINLKFVRITCDIILESYYSFKDFLGNSLRYIVLISRLLLPYIMWYIGIYLYNKRGKFVIGGELLIPFIVFIITSYLRQFANRIGRGEKIPIPEKRFTEPGEEDGEYTVETNRLEEMILYMSNLEDWLQRKGLLRK